MLEQYYTHDKRTRKKNNKTLYQYTHKYHWRSAIFFVYRHLVIGMCVNLWWFFYLFIRHNDDERATKPGITKKNFQKNRFLIFWTILGFTLSWNNMFSIWISIFTLDLRLKNQFNLQKYFGSFNEIYQKPNIKIHFKIV